MSINSNDYRVPLDKKVDLGKWPTTIDPYYKSKKQYQELLERHMQKLSSLQQLHFASHRYALLLIFQGMDGAGKDGAIRHVMSGVNPGDCEVFNFKQASAEELDHDFLWRTTSRLPERGRIGIFNRSFYEEVLVVRVHPEILRDQGLPKELLDEKNIWDHRYTSIVDLEKHLHRNGTRTIKIFLHLPMRNSEGDSWRASTSQTRTGSSVRRTFMRGSIGNATGRPTRIASTRQALIMRLVHRSGRRQGVCTANRFPDRP